MDRKSINEFATARHAYQAYLHGIRHNQTQFIYQLLQVLMVGLTLGMMRTVVPALVSDRKRGQQTRADGCGWSG